MNGSRTENSVKNSITSIISNICAILIGFIAQAIFIKILGAEYLGLNGLFTNILTMLSLFELGIGNAIVYNMYKPISENDVQKIKSLMKFYKKSYDIIAMVVFSIGIVIMPFITVFVGTLNIDINIYLVYFLFLISTVVSYLMIYKRNMIYASQQNYIINVIHCVYLILLNIMQLVILYFTRNYYIYLIIKIICQVIENIVINYICNKKYPFLLEKNVDKLDKNIEKSIFSKVKALICHKIGYIIVNGTDNIIISKYFGVITVGLYNNYYTVINAITILFSQIITSLTASVGNLIVNADSEKVYGTFSKIRFCNFWISCFTATAILLMIQPFIKIWIGEEYLLNNAVIMVLVFNFFQKMQRNCYITFKDSAGIWEEDKFIPIIEAGVNVVASVILLKFFGLSGAFMGTIISGLILWCYSYPRYVYKTLFKRTYSNYIKETFGYVLLFILIASITYVVAMMFKINNVFLKFIINTVVGIIIPNIIIIVLFRKTDNFKYFMGLIRNIFKKIMYKNI